MKGIILAAGRGSRMQGTTAEQPKCFVQIGGKRLIEWQMDALQKAGIPELGIVRGYLPNAFNYEVRYFDNLQWAETNMLMSLRTADEWLKADECVVSYSDIVYAPKSVERLIASAADIAITYDPQWLNLWSLRFEEPLSDAETFKLDGDSNLIEIGGKTTNVSEIEGQFMGLLKFTPRGWTVIQNYLSSVPPILVQKMDMTKLLRGLIAAGVKVQAVKIQEPWYEVDNEHDLAQYQRPGVFRL